MQSWGVILLVCLVVELFPSGSSALDVCQTQACSDYVTKLEENMDLSVNPCDDFYSFNCGSFLNRIVLNKNESSFGQFDIMERAQIKLLDSHLRERFTSEDDLWTRNAKNFYKSCINIDNDRSERTVKSALKELNDLGGWPLLTGEDNPNSPLDLFGLLFQYDFSPIIFFMVDTDARNAVNRIIQVYQPEYIDPSYYQDPEYLSATKEYYQTVLGYLNQGKQPIDETQLDEMLQVEIQFTNAQIDRNELRTGVKNVPMTVSELQDKYPNFPWIEFITQKMFMSNPEITVDENEVVLVNDIAYMKKVHDIYLDVSTNNPTALKNYMIANFFSSLIIGNLPRKYREAGLIVSKLRDGIEELPNRENTCVLQTMDVLYNEVGRLWVKKEFTNKIKKDVEDMTKKLLLTFQSMLNKNTWMDRDSKRNALDKLKFLKPQIGFPNYYNNDTYRKNNFNYVLGNDNLVKSVLEVNKYAHRFQKLGKLRQPVDRDYWSFSAAIINAFYDPTSNQIYMPAGILVSPIYNADLPQYMNYGSVGMIIGHELTHGFDDEGRSYDKLGQYIPDSQGSLWSSQTIEKFKSITQCMIKQYSNYFVISTPDKDIYINGEQTLGENIADNGGAKETYQAYKNLKLKEKPLGTSSQFTPEQLMFINMAQVWCAKYTDELAALIALEDYHSFPKYRVNGVMANSQGFHDAFKCGDLTTDCSVW